MSEKNMIKTDLGDVKPVVEAGGKNSVYFLPNLNMSFFDDEFFININRKEKKITKDCAVTNHKTKLICGGDTDLFYVDEEGNFKWDIEFTEKPETNIFTWELKCSNDIEFIYQGVLTQDEINDGCTRDEKIIGSYAVYCNRKNGKYKTGKICHIPRPFVIDNDNKTEWCVLKIENNTLTITLPETFMQNASYPVTLDPTFGYNSTGASENLKNSDELPIGLLYGTHTAGSGESITQYSFYGRAYSSNATVEMAAYSVSGGDFVSRLAAAVSISVTGTEYQWWNSSTISQSLESGTTYGLGWYTSSSAYVYTKFDAEYDFPSSYHSTAESLPATWSESSTVNRKYSIYATYSEGGGTTGNLYYYFQNQ